MKKITEKVEPEMLARAMLRGEDDAVRTTDLPEREQLKPSPEPKACGIDSPMLDACAAGEPALLAAHARRSHC